MITIIAAVFRLCLGWITGAAFRWVAFKTFFSAVMLYAFPVLFLSIWGRVSYTVYQKMNDASTGVVGTSGITSNILHLTGLAGYLASNLYIPQAVAMVLSAVACRFALDVLGKIPMGFYKK